VSVINAGTIGYISSNASSWLAVARPASMSAVSCIVLIRRLAARTASAFTTGNRGATPPPVGWGAASLAPCRSRAAGRECRRGPNVSRHHRV